MNTTRFANNAMNDIIQPLKTAEPPVCLSSPEESRLAICRQFDEAKVHEMLRAWRGEWQDNNVCLLGSKVCLCAFFLNYKYLQAFVFWLSCMRTSPKYIRNIWIRQHVFCLQVCWKVLDLIWFQVPIVFFFHRYYPNLLTIKLHCYALGPESHVTRMRKFMNFRRLPDKQE